MDCNQIPAPELWDEESDENLQAYHSHVQFCSRCRANVLKRSPEKLLFALKQDRMPEEFWLGFWDSVSRKKNLHKTHTSKTMLATAALRWIAVLIVALVIGLYGHSLPEEQQTRVNSTADYPVIENLRNPQAHYYIFQTTGQKVVMVFDPEVEL